MAARHNEYGQLLGTVENGAIPMAGVPDLESIADCIDSDAAFHQELMTGHAQRVRDVAQMQPKFSDITTDGSARGGVF